MDSTDEQELARLMQRNGYTEDEARARMATQIPLGEKAAKADLVLDNTQSLAHTRKQVCTNLASKVQQRKRGNPAVSTS